MNSSTMKVFLFLLGILIALECVQSESGISEVIQKCKDKIGMSEENNDPEKKKCLFACLLKEFGVMENGEIKREVAKESTKKMLKGKADDNAVDSAVDECADKVKDLQNECDKAFTFKKCMKEKMKNNSDQ